MARRITGFTIERKRVEIDAHGRVSPAECLTNPTECCDETPTERYGVGAATCCPDGDQADTVEAVAEGPLGVGGATREVDVTLAIQVEDRLTWTGTGATSAGDEVVEMFLKLWCSTAEDEDEDLTSFWRLYGEYVTGDGEMHRFTIDLEEDEDGVHLNGEVTVPGQEDAMTLVVERPCTGLVAGTIATACCPDDLLPTTLYMIFSGASANLTCFNGVTVALPHTSGQSWDSLLTVLPCSGTGVGVKFECDVPSELWAATIGGAGGVCFATTDTGMTITCGANTVATGTLTFAASACGTGDGSGTVNFAVTRTAP